LKKFEYKFIAEINTKIIDTIIAGNDGNLMVKEEYRKRHRKKLLKKTGNALKKKK
jgi:hypothetical protein